MAEEKWVGEITKEEAKSRVVRRMTDEEKEILNMGNRRNIKLFFRLGSFVRIRVRVFLFSICVCF